jgi:hypothetical protein
MNFLEKGQSVQSFCPESDMLRSKVYYDDQPHTNLPYLIPVSSVLYLEVKTAPRKEISGH